MKDVLIGFNFLTAMVFPLFMSNFSGKTFKWFYFFELCLVFMLIFLIFSDMVVVLH